MISDYLFTTLAIIWSGIDNEKESIFCPQQENKRLSKDYSDMKARLSVREADNLKLEDLLDRLQEEKKRLTQRNNKLTANGTFGINQTHKRLKMNAF